MMLPFPIIKQLPNKKENNKYNKYKNFDFQ